MTKIIFLLMGCAFSLGAFTQPLSAAALYQDDLVQVELYPLHDRLQAGETNLLGLEFQLKTGWHIYWENPGDSGAPLIMDWTWTGAELTNFHFPPPKRIPIDPLINFGYEDQVIFPIQVQVEPLIRQVQANLELEWLVCKVECIPGFASLSLTVPAGDKIGSAHPRKPQALKFLQSAPVQTPQSGKLVKQQENQFWFTVQLPMSLASGSEVQIFPYDNLFFSSHPPDELVTQGSELLFSLRQTASHLTQPPDPRALIAVKEDSHSLIRSFVVQLDFNPSHFDWLAILTVLALAFLGGILLNAMPCVLPVLSIKILSFSQSSRSPREFKLSSWLYSLGVVLSFALMGLALQLIRLGGEEIGWGFQLQNPVFVSAMAMLFFLLGLNFLGVFEWGETLRQQSGKLSPRTHGNSGAFFTGVLAALVASPCTAPFMGTALGASLMLSAWLSPLVFVSLGLGMAFPFLLVAQIPRLLEMIPRPGPWMVKLKEFFAFPLFLTSLWLIWVLSLQTQMLHILVLLVSFTCLGFSFWLLKNFQWPAIRWLARLFVVLSLVAPAWLAFNMDTNTQPHATQANSSSIWQTFNPDQVQTLVNQGESVFIDFTAAWCITCQVNKINVLETQRTLNLFAEHGVHLFRADWTRRDPEITRALAEYGRNSLPVYVFYPSNSLAQFRLLPELLTPGMIDQLFNPEETTQGGF